MCNLYRMTQNADEIARLFSVGTGEPSNAGGEVYPGYPGLVVTDAVRPMTWGFPLVLRSKRTGEPLKPKPVNNARTDKLGTGFWSASFRERRCLIPVSAWAEAEGPKGKMTRTWLSLPDQPLFAVAGLWRETTEWGPAYAMIMTDAADTTREVHSRMPVILSPDDWARWRTLPVDEALALCRPWSGAVTIERSDEPWTRR